MTSGLAKARHRVGVKSLAALFALLAGPPEPIGGGACCCARLTARPC